MSDETAEDGLDPEDEVEALIERLEQSEWNALPNGPIPPADRTLLEPARAEARAWAVRTGRDEALTRAQRMMADWTLEQYGRSGFGAAYFTGWLDTPERRLEVVDLMVDAATAVAMADLLSDETQEILTARFDELHGGSSAD